MNMQTHQNDSTSITEEIFLPEVREKEAHRQQLWERFYDKIFKESLIDDEELEIEQLRQDVGLEPQRAAYHMPIDMVEHWVYTHYLGSSNKTSTDVRNKSINLSPTISLSKSLQKKTSSSSHSTSMKSAVPFTNVSDATTINLKNSVDTDGSFDIFPSKSNLNNKADIYKTKSVKIKRRKLYTESQSIYDLSPMDNEANLKLELKSIPVQTMRKDLMCYDKSGDKSGELKKSVLSKNSDQEVVKSETFNFSDSKFIFHTSSSKTSCLKNVGNNIEKKVIYCNSSESSAKDSIIIRKRIFSRNRKPKAVNTNLNVKDINLSTKNCASSLGNSNKSGDISSKCYLKSDENDVSVDELQNDKSNFTKTDKLQYKCSNLDTNSLDLKSDQSEISSIDNIFSKIKKKTSKVKSDLRNKDTSVKDNLYESYGNKLLNTISHSTEDTVRSRYINNVTHCLIPVTSSDSDNDFEERQSVFHKKKFMPKGSRSVNKSKTCNLTKTKTDFSKLKPKKAKNFKSVPSSNKKLKERIKKYSILNEKKMLTNSSKSIILKKVKRTINNPTHSFNETYISRNNITRDLVPISSSDSDDDYIAPLQKSNKKSSLQNFTV